MPWSEGMVYRRNPVSSMDMFSAVRMGNNGKRYRWRMFGRRPLGVNQANALLTVYTPLAKADSLITGSPDAFYDEIEKAEKEKPQLSEAERRIALATNAAGVMAAPAAIFAASRAAKRNEGGLPRESVTGIARLVQRKRPGSRTAKKVLDTAEALGNPTSRQAKIAAAGLGGAAIGLQLANASGDFIAARAMHRAKGDTRS